MSVCASYLLNHVNVNVSGKFSGFISIRLSDVALLYFIEYLLFFHKLLKLNSIFLYTVVLKMPVSMTLHAIVVF